jgi:hypothetical protein
MGASLMPFRPAPIRGWRKKDRGSIGRFPTHPGVRTVDRHRRSGDGPLLTRRKVMQETFSGRRNVGPKRPQAAVPAAAKHVVLLA